MLSRNIPHLWSTSLAAVSFAVIVLVMATPRWVRGDRRGAVRMASLALLVGGIFLVLTVSFAMGDRLMEVDARGQLVLGHSLNLKPLSSIRDELNNPERTTGLVNIVGNMALFAPIGCFARTLTGWPVRVVLLCGCTLSVVVESVQYFTHRIADIDDVLLNATGTLIGALLGALLMRVFTRQDTTVERATPQPA